MNGAQGNARYGLPDQSNLSGGSNNVDQYNNSGMVFHFYCASIENGPYYIFFILNLVNAHSLPLAGFHPLLVHWYIHNISERHCAINVLIC